MIWKSFNEAQIISISNKFSIQIKQTHLGYAPNKVYDSLLRVKCISGTSPSNSNILQTPNSIKQKRWSSVNGICLRHQGSHIPTTVQNCNCNKPVMYKVGVSVLMNCGGEITRRDSACSFSVSLTASNCRLNCMIDACQLITNYLSFPGCVLY